MMISKDIRNYLKKIGKKGGMERAKRLNASVRSFQARHAVVSRWIHHRFGADNFEKMGIPGWEIVDSGLSDIVNGNFLSVNALVVAEIRPKLRFLGVPVPEVSRKISNIRMMLYNTMEKQHGDMAYARFCALLERVDSFCNALSAVVRIPKNSSHRYRRWYA